MTRRRKVFDRDRWNYTPDPDTEEIQQAQEQARQEAALAGIAVADPTGDADMGVGGPYVPAQVRRPTTFTGIGIIQPDSPVGRIASWVGDSLRDALTPDPDYLPRRPSGQPSTPDEGLDPYRGRQQPPEPEPLTFDFDPFARSDQPGGAVRPPSGWPSAPNPVSETPFRPGLGRDQQTFVEGVQQIPGAIVRGAADAYPDDKPATDDLRAEGWKKLLGAAWDRGTNTPVPIPGMGSLLQGPTPKQLAEGTGQAIEWYGKNVNEPGSGVASAAIGALYPEPGDVMRPGQVAPALSPNSMAAVNDIVRRAREKNPETPGDWVGALWASSGEFQRERPDVFPGEKFITETVFDPGNLIGVGLEPKIAQQVVRLAKAAGIGAVEVAGRAGLAVEAGAQAAAANPALRRVGEATAEGFSDVVGPGRRPPQRPQGRPVDKPDPDALDQTDIFGNPTDAHLQQQGMDLPPDEVPPARPPGAVPDEVLGGNTRAPLTPEEEAAINQGARRGVAAADAAQPELGDVVDEAFDGDLVDLAEEFARLSRPDASDADLARSMDVYAQLDDWVNSPPTDIMALDQELRDLPLQYRRARSQEAIEALNRRVDTLQEARPRLEADAWNADPNMRIDALRNMLADDNLMGDAAYSNWFKLIQPVGRFAHQVPELLTVKQYRAMGKEPTGAMIAKEMAAVDKAKAAAKAAGKKWNQYTPPTIGLDNLVDEAATARGEGVDEFLEGVQRLYDARREAVTLENSLKGTGRRRGPQGRRGIEVTRNPKYLGVTDSASVLLERLDNGGTLPSTIDSGLKKIAKANGINAKFYNDKTRTPEEIINALRQKARPAAGTPEGTPPSGTGGTGGEAPPPPPREPVPPPETPLPEGQKEHLTAQHVRLEPDTWDPLSTKLTHEPMGYVPVSNRETVARANGLIAATSDTDVLERLRTWNDQNDLDLLAAGEIVLQRHFGAIRTAPDPQAALDNAYNTLDILVDAASRTAQKLQLMSLRNFLTPEGKLLRQIRHRRKVADGRSPGNKTLARTKLTPEETEGALQFYADADDFDFPDEVIAAGQTMGWDKYLDYRRAALNKIGYPLRDDFVTQETYDEAMREWRKAQGGSGMPLNNARPEGDLNLQAPRAQVELGSDLEAFAEAARKAEGKTPEEWAAIAEERRRQLAEAERERQRLAYEKMRESMDTGGAPGPVREQATTTEMTAEALEAAQREADARGGLTWEQHRANVKAREEEAWRNRQDPQPPQTEGAPEGTLQGQPTTPNLTPEAVAAANAAPNPLPKSRGVAEITADIESLKTLDPKSREYTRQFGLLRSELMQRNAVGTPLERKAYNRMVLVALAEEAKVNPLGIMDKASAFQNIMLLLNPKTTIRNIGGNVFLLLADHLARGIAAGIDTGIGAATGRRTVTRPATFGQALEAARRQIDPAIENARLGITETRMTGGANKFDIQQAPAFKGVPVLGGGETLLNLSLRATDQLFQGVAFESALEEGARLAAMNKGLSGVDQQVDMLKQWLNPSDDLIAYARSRALTNTFADESLAAAFFVNVKRALNIVGAGGTGGLGTGGSKRGLRYGGFGLGDLILKYPKTPANLLVRAAEYSPLGFLSTALDVSRSVYELKIMRAALPEGEIQRKIAEGMGRAVVGSGITAFGWGLANLGILTAGSSDDPDLRALDRDQGGGQFKINVDAAMRFATTLDPEQAKRQKGDELWSYDWAQPLSVSLAMGGAGNERNMRRTKQKPGASGSTPLDTLLDVTGGYVTNMLRETEPATIGFNTLVEQPMISGVTRLIRDLGDDFQGDNPGGDVVSTLVTTLALAPAAFVPTLLNQVTQAVDGTVRETYDEDRFMAGLKRAVARIPVLSGALLPSRIDTLGQPIRRDEAEGDVTLLSLVTGMTDEQKGRLFGVFVNPAIATRYIGAPAAEMVAEIYKASGQMETQQVPRVAPKTLKVAGETFKLTADQYRTLQENMGRRTNEVFAVLAQDQAFRSMTPKEQAEELKTSLDQISAQAKDDLRAIRDANTNLPPPAERGTKETEKPVSEKQMQEYLADKARYFSQYDQIKYTVAEREPEFLKVYLEDQALVKNEPPGWQVAREKLHDSFEWKMYQRQVQREQEYARDRSPGLAAALRRWRQPNLKEQQEVGPPVTRPQGTISTPVPTSSGPVSRPIATSGGTISRPVSPVGAR